MDALLSHRRHADNMEHTGSLSLCAHHAVQGGKLANRIGGHKHRATSDACIPIGSVCGVQFVRATDPLDRLVAHHGIAKPKNKIPGNAEALRDSLLCQPFDDVVRYSDSMDHDEVSVARLREPSRRSDLSFSNSPGCRVAR